jgi:ubiquinone/menaquinone biosynthesis C-methylase UbiE
MDLTRLAEKYHGETASSYDAEREGSPGWQFEQEAVEAQLGTLPAGSRVLDVPVGTGRFLSAYERHGFEAVGVDVSTSMIAEAQKKFPGAELREGSILELPFPDDSFDCVVCVRFLNWIGGDVLDRAVAELARVSRGAIICDITTFDDDLTLVRRLRQWKLRFYRWRKNQYNFIYHEPDRLATLFARNGLTVRRTVPYPRGRPWKIGLQRMIYVLGVE